MRLDRLRQGAPETILDRNRRHKSIPKTISVVDPGSRLIQECLGFSAEHTRRLLLRQFHGHVFELMLSPHGNYILTKAFFVT